MISCDSFRTRFHAGTEDAALLEHLRACDRCLDLAAHSDPDVMFRALGGAEMIPPGGIDLFVSGVMQQVRVREAESAMNASPVLSWPRRLAMAAAVGAAVFGATLVYRTDVPSSPVRTVQAVTRPVASTVASTSTRAITTKPIVETYESDSATIMEMPAESSDEVQIVMIFDENLPADL